MMNLEEYMRELVLMGRQYGQEEELYPLINMLLRENPQMKNLSLRTVANGRTNKDGIKDKIDRDMLFGYASFPDLAILSPNCDLIVKNKGEHEMGQADNMYGCVEAKVIGETLFTLNKEINISKNDYKTALVLAEKIVEKNNKARIYIEFSGVMHNCFEAHNKYVHLDNIEDIKNIFPDEIEITVSKCNGIYTENVIKKTAVCFSDKDRALEHIKNTMKEVENESVDKENKKTIERWNRKFFYRVAGIDEQIFGEVIWYGKVLYTNGIVWKYLELDEPERKKIRAVLDNGYVGERRADWIGTLAQNEKIEEITVSCHEIGNLEDESIGKDLVELINKIKAGESVDLNEVQEKASNNVAWKNEWNRLKYNLATIDWTGSNVYSQFK